MELKVHIRGSEKVKRELRSWGKRYPRALAAALYQEGLAVSAKAVRLVPVDTGRLRSTAFVAPPTRDGARARVEVGFGTDYAVPVHERDVPHRVGQSKYLEAAFAERQNGYLSRLLSRTKQLAKAGVGVEAIPATSPTSPRAGGGQPTSRAARARARLKGRR